MKKSTKDKESMPEGWNESVLNAVDSVVDKANTMVVKPAHKVAKYFVYSMVTLVLIFVIVVVLSIASFRVLNLALPVWGSYLSIGAVFVLIGSIFWAKK